MSQPDSVRWTVEAPLILTPDLIRERLDRWYGSREPRPIPWVRCICGGRFLEVDFQRHLARMQGNSKRPHGRI